MQYSPRPLPLFLDMVRSEAAASPGLATAALAGLAAYQRAPRRPSPPPLPALVEANGARLLDAGGDGPPVVLVPSLINPAAILDLDADASLTRWLAGRGLRPLLVDWGAPADAALDLAGHVEHRLLPLLDAVDGPVRLVGYCLGGTLALAAAALRPVAGVATVAAPWRFSGYGQARRAEIARLWAGGRHAVDALGLVPMELLQSGFWRLDPARTVAKYARFAALDPDDPAARAFVRLEDWANAGAPLTAAAGRDLFERFFAADEPGHLRWRVAGRPVDPAAIGCPLLEIVSTTDRITPAGSAAGVGRRLALDLGHVGMIVGARARAALWSPLAEWLRKPQVAG